jgi:prepilin-type N-terminal cleavage/methylation domain-containing protein
MRNTMRNERGMTLIELLIAMTVFLIVLGGVVKAIGSQSQGFRKGSDELGILQNLRYGIDQVEQDLRLAGGNVANRQPIVVYAGANAFAFNADIQSNVAGDISAVYIDVDALAGEVQGWPMAGATVIPGSSPSFTYPLADYVNNAAETVMFWFTADTSTTRADDFVLMRRVNARPEEVLMRNILQPTTGNFFKYWYNFTPAVGDQTLDSVPTAWYPLSHSAAVHGSLPDTGVLTRVDLVRATELRYRVTNGSTGSAERIRSTNAMLVMPNSGFKKLSTCGDTPIFGKAVTAAWDATNSEIDLSWAISVDELSGEGDVIRYLVWRRAGAVGTWGDPISALAASGAANYSFQDTQVSSGVSYTYAVSAQDCTPALSTQSVSNTVAVP